MNKSLIKFLTDFGPLVIFFYFYYNSGKDLQVAIPPLIVATIISVLILNFRWTWFFFGLAILNELVWRTQTEEFWGNFKVWGMLPITFIFTAFQIPLIKKYSQNE